MTVELGETEPGAGLSGGGGWLSTMARRPGIWLIWRKKRAGAQPLTLDEAVQEALCFG